MLWIKRNLFLTVSAIVALALLGGGGYYVYAALASNAELDAEVQSTRTELNGLYALDVFPHATNIAAAKAETAKLRAEVASAHKLFMPVPGEKVDARGFSRLRDNTLDELRNVALKGGVRLPADPYAFSFQTQKSKTEFAPDTFPLVPEQMTEIKALCMILFEARINQIGNIRRARVSRDDRTSVNSSDYLSPILNNELIAGAEAASHPYEFTFFCFTSELAAVLNSLERSPQGFVTKAMMVEPDPSAPGAPAGTGIGTSQPPPPHFQPPPGRNPNLPRLPLPRPGVPVAPGVARPPANDKPLYVLKEKRLKVTMLVYAIKPAK
ncbi:MAG: hypothetical protein QOF48_3229 [Verrucomicrobiota bacterium]|jgi:hypothetical protein